MRLWHSKLIPLLDGKRLCDVHMSCCNLRGKGWGKRNVAINYLYEDPLGEDSLVAYHQRVLEEMSKRGYNFNVNWLDIFYCGVKRPRRNDDYRNYTKVLLRSDVPIKGHDLDMYLNDVRTLQERGLEIETWEVTSVDDLGYYTVYHAKREDIEITYGIRIGGITNEQ